MSFARSFCIFLGRWVRDPFKGPRIAILVTAWPIGSKRANLMLSFAFKQPLRWETSADYRAGKSR